MTLFYREMASPIGKLKLIANANALVAIISEREHPDRLRLEAPSADRHHHVLVQAERQLGAYFAGKRATFELPLAPQGTEFQKKVWSCLKKIPFGKTKSYGDLAKALGSPRASRAVGAACGKNPLAIVIPCHRVIGANGSLTGFGAGLETKAALLALEARANQPTVSKYFCTR
jgi:methylated-DNA-[protein]-cysteine S-methyltransferase